MFKGASSFNGDVSKWDMSWVTDMSGMFDGASSFDGDLSNWDTSSVKWMNSMFENASSFSKILCWNLTSLDKCGQDNIFDNTNGANFDPKPFPDCLTTSVPSKNVRVLVFCLH